MMLRRSHPGREVQGGAATCGWVLGGDSRSRRGGPGRGFCHSRDKMPSWLGRDRDRDSRELAHRVQGMQAGKQRAEERRKKRHGAGQGGAERKRS